MRLMKGKTTKSGKPADEDILSAVTEAVREYCRIRRPVGSIDGSLCGKRAMEAFKAVFRKERGYSRSGAMSAEHLMEMDSLYKRLRPRMDGIVNDAVLKFGTDRITHEIRSASTEALVRDLLADAGFAGCDIICQRYRAKVTVRRPGKYKVMFIIRYKDVESGRAKAYVDRLVEFTEEIGSLPFEVKVWK